MVYLLRFRSALPHSIAFDGSATEEDGVICRRRTGREVDMFAAARHATVDVTEAPFRCRTGDRSDNPPELWQQDLDEHGLACQESPVVKSPKRVAIRERVHDTIRQIRSACVGALHWVRFLWHVSRSCRDADRLPQFEREGLQTARRGNLFGDFGDSGFRCRALLLALHKAEDVGVAEGPIIQRIKNETGAKVVELFGIERRTKQLVSRQADLETLRRTENALGELAVKRKDIKAKKKEIHMAPPPCSMELLVLTNHKVYSKSGIVLLEYELKQS